MLENKWPDSVSDKVFNLLSKAIERKICKIIKSPYIPTTVERNVLQKRYNKHGMAIFDEIKYEGIECSRSTKPHDLDDVDIFWFDCFLNLTESERISILAYVDPLNEFSEKEIWNEFIQKEFKTTRSYNLTIGRAVFKLQKLAEELGLVRVMNVDELKGWDAISGYWNVSVKTMKKLVHKHRLPVIYLEGNVYALKSKLDDRKMEIYSDKQNYVWARKGKKRYEN
jgi:hypothetical protein